jgi:hypothetical protein
MLRTLDLALIGAMVAAAAFTYHVKHGAEQELDQIHRLRAQIRLEEDTIDLLKADWAVLIQPARLQKLVEFYKPQLHLETLQPQQIATLNDIPSYPKPENPPVPTLLPVAKPPLVASAVPPAVDPLKTGSVAR